MLFVSDEKDRDLHILGRFDVLDKSVVFSQLLHKQMMVT